MQLIHAEGAMLAQILGETFPIWHEGLTRINYERWNVAQMRTPGATITEYRVRMKISFLLKE